MENLENLDRCAIPEKKQDGSRPKGTKKRNKTNAPLEVAGTEHPIKVKGTLHTAWATPALSLFRAGRHLWRPYGAE